MRFANVGIEAVAHVLPERSVSSLALEERLAPLYARLGLSPGRLELMSGIRERRFWEPGTRPSSVASRAGALALEKSGIARERIGCLIHASVCRDFLEPATASVVHSALGLDDACTVFDLSNACLGFANAMCTIGAQIERGEIDAGLVVAGEDGGPLVEATLAALLALHEPDLGLREPLALRDPSSAGDRDLRTEPASDRELRNALKRAYASLTIGSGAAAMVLARAELCSAPHRLLGGVVRADTRHHELCQGNTEPGAAGPLMETDSEALLQAGNALAARTFEHFQRELGWTRADIERVITHQVGSAHRRLLLATLELDPARDFPTVETCGNIGSVSLPLSLSLAHEQGFVQAGERVALLGIGSGLHCLMLGVRW